jgi:hypothetical protein
MEKKRFLEGVYAESKDLAMKELSHGKEIGLFKF